MKEPKQLTQQQLQHEAHLLQLLQSALDSHTLYYSNSHHVTHTLQRCAAMTVNSPTLLKQTSLSLGSYSQKANDQKQPVFTSDVQWDKADDRFFWNRKLVNSLIAAGADEWIMPLMNAHVEVKRNCRIGGTSKGRLTLLIVARRSRKQQGCRYNKRGCAIPSTTAANISSISRSGATSSCSGDISNFVEIEQIVLPERGGVSSYTQVNLY
jgi:SacI homology domain